MSLSSRLSYSISIAVLLTALAYLFVPGMGEFIAIPGMIIKGLVDLIFFMSVMEPDVFPSVGNWMIFNVLFYSVLIFIGLWVYGRIRNTTGKMK